MIFSEYPSIALRTPSDVSKVRIDNALEGNRMKAAVWNLADVTIRRTAPIQTKCSGYHCDKQRPQDWTHSNTRGCGCWGSTELGGTNIALMHTIFAKLGDKMIFMKGFSSTKFNKLFMNGPIPSNVMVISIQNNAKSEMIQQAV